MGYWDLEEGRDCVGKTWITTKLGTALGHSAMTGFGACMGLGTVAMFTKVGKMEGWNIFSPPKM